MSIPKEPRQAMINIMYLVLTAMLALNVSAEILNAFTTLDKSLTESNNIVSTANGNMLSAIDQQAQAYSQFAPYFAKAKEVKTLSNDFYDYVEHLKSEIIEVSGGVDEHNLPKGLKNKDITTRLLVDEGKGEALKTKVLEARADLLNLVDEEVLKSSMSETIPLNINEVPADSEKENWAQFTFQQMPVAAVLPLLTKMQNDMKVSETAVLNFLFKKISENSAIILDAYQPVVSANAGYIIKGEPYEAEIFLGAYSTTTDNIFVDVDGRSYPVRDGKATFKTQPGTIGTKNHQLSIRVKDPMTDEVKTYKKQFSYEVGERSVAVSADKMNVFYVGVENPLTVSAAGVPTGQLEVRAEGVNIQKLTNDKYVVKPTHTGRAKIIVSGGGLAPTSFEYRVKPIPTPVVKLGTKTSGTMSANELKIYKELTPFLDGFDFNARCNIVGFELARAPKKDDPKFSTNPGGKFSTETQRIINQAKRGDVYYFDKVKVRCPGDRNNRETNGLIFKIR